VRLRRRGESPEPPEPSEEGASLLPDDPALQDAPPSGVPAAPSHGPFDFADARVDEESGTVLAVLLGNEEGAVELRAFAAARNGDLWSDARREIAADAARRGGTATEVEGPLGPELQVQIPVTTPDGQAAVQPSRVFGHNGPRWFLRATLLGRPAMEPGQDDFWVSAIRSVVVRRGNEAMPPGEALPLQLPPQARRVD
jgi:hypothetical protein